MDIAKEIAVRAADIEQRIQMYLPKAEGYQHTIFEAMDYSVTAGGKRLRPMLMEASYEMFGGTEDCRAFHGGNRMYSHVFAGT